MFEEQEKYYARIRAVNKKESAIEPDRGHHLLSNERKTGRISGTFCALQPLHIGTGQLVPPATVGLVSNVPLVKPFFAVDGRLTIPGSSLKGAVRSTIELFTHSCICKVAGKDRRRVDYGQKECRYNSKRQNGELCLACKMFGAMGYQGQVEFSDNPRTDGADSGLKYIPPQHQPKGNLAERRYYPHALVDTRRATWPLEVAPVATGFNFQVRFRNLTAAELGVLLIALGQGDPALALKIGAGKSVGLGAVEFTQVTVELLDVRQSYRQYATGESWVSAESATLIPAENPLIIKHHLQTLQDDLGRKHFPRGDA